MGQFEALVGVNFWTAFFILLNTLAIYFVAKKYLTDPVMKIIDKRQKEIEDTYEKAEQAEGAALAMKEDCATARTEEMMTAARAEVAALKTKADQEIESERRKAAGELKNDISELVLNIAGLVVEKELDPAAHKGLIDDFIRHVGDE